MKLLTFLSTLVLTIIISSCASYKDRVVQRMDDLEEKPSWASLHTTTFAKNGKLYSVGFSEGSGSAKISPLLKLASHNARTKLTREVANNIGVVYQAVEEGTDGGELSRYIGTEKSLVLTREIRHSKTYYQKVLTTTSMGDKEVRIQMYALVEIPEPTLRKLIKTSLDEQNQISGELKAKVDKQLDKLLENQVAYKLKTQEN